MTGGVSPPQVYFPENSFEFLLLYSEGQLVEHRRGREGTGGKWTRFWGMGISSVHILQALEWLIPPEFTSDLSVFLSWSSQTKVFARKMSPSRDCSPFPLHNLGVNGLLCPLQIPQILCFTRVSVQLCLSFIFWLLL